MPMPWRASSEVLWEYILSSGVYFPSSYCENFTTVIRSILSQLLSIGALLDKSFITSGFLASLMITFWVWAGGIFLASIGYAGIPSLTTLLSYFVRTIKAAGVLGCIAAMIAYFLAIYRLSVASKLAAGSLWDIT